MTTAPFGPGKRRASTSTKPRARGNGVPYAVACAREVEPLERGLRSQATSVPSGASTRRISASAPSRSGQTYTTLDAQDRVERAVAGHRRTCDHRDRERTSVMSRQRTHPGSSSPRTMAVQHSITCPRVNHSFARSAMRLPAKRSSVPSSNGTTGSPWNARNCRPPTRFSSSVAPPRVRRGVTYCAANERASEGTWCSIDSDGAR